jgi:predicted PurR-regulated permease PerM
MADSSETPLRGALYLLAFFVVVTLLREARSIVVPIAFALFLALLGSPALRWLRGKRVPRGAASILVVLGMMAILVLTIVILTTSLQDLTTRVPAYQAAFDNQVNSMLRNPDDPWSVREVIETIDPASGVTFVVGIMSDVLGVLGNMFLILIIAAFMLLEGEIFPAKLAAAFGASDRRSAAVERFGHSLTTYAGLKSIVCLATGVAVGLFTWAMGLDLPLLLGFLAFVLNYIPNIGSWIAAIPALLISFVLFGPQWTLLVAVGYLALNALISNVIEPRIMGRGLGLSPLVVFLSVMVSGWVLGPVGVILAIPIVMSIKFALEAAPATQHLAVLFGNGPGTDET